MEVHFVCFQYYLIVIPYFVVFQYIIICSNELCHGLLN